MYEYKSAYWMNSAMCFLHFSELNWYTIQSNKSNINIAEYMRELNEHTINRVSIAAK